MPVTCRLWLAHSSTSSSFSWPLIMLSSVSRCPAIHSVELTLNNLHVCMLFFAGE